MTDQPVDGLVDTEMGARILDVPAGVIRVWRARRRVVPAQITRGRGPHRGTPLYLLDELRPLADAYHQRTTRRTEET